jgi:cell division protein FtsB
MRPDTMTRRPADGPLRPERLRPRRRGLPPAASRWLRRGIALAVAAVAVNALVGERGVFETMRVKREQDALAASIEGLRRENAELASRIRSLQSDARAIEDVARRQFGYARRGEVVFMVKDVATPGASTAPVQGRAGVARR